MSRYDMPDALQDAYSMLGGCTTRDAADPGSRPLPRPVRCFSRSRLQSIVSAPSPIDPADVDLKSAFQRRVVVEDHDKTLARTLAKLDHPLLMDLVGERSPSCAPSTGSSPPRTTARPGWAATAPPRCPRTPSWPTAGRSLRPPPTSPRSCPRTCR